jgi:NDP-sugar pyrophosphorylase family protein
MSIPVAILAGGLATRMHPATERIPKALLDIGGQPFIARQLELLHEHGLNDIVLCVGYLGEQIHTAISDGGRWGVRVRYVFDGPTLLGTGGALRRALSDLGPEFLVLYGDSYLDCDYSAVVDFFRRDGRAGLMTVCRNEGRWDRSNVVYENGGIAEYDKLVHTPAMQYIDYGLGAFRASALETYAEDRSLDLSAVYKHLLARGQLAGYEVHQRFYEIGSPDGLEETRRYITQERPRHHGPGASDSRSL